MCFSGMFFISELVAGICVVAAIALYLTIQRQINLDHKADTTSSGGETQIKTDWRAGRRFQSARQSLLALKDGDLDFKVRYGTNVGTSRCGTGGTSVGRLG